MRWLLGLMVVVVLFLHNLPYLIRDQAVIWLRDQGVEQVSIKALKVDWLQGEINLTGVSARSDAQLPLQLEQLHVALDYAALMQKRIRIRDLSVTGLTSGVAQREQQLWLGPLNLSGLGSAEPEPAERADEAPSEWLFGIDQLRLTGIDWQAQLPKQKHHLVITQAALDRLYLWDMQQVTDLVLEGSLNGAPLKVSTAMTPLPDRKRSELRLQVTQFPLHSVTALFEPGLRALVDLDLLIEAEVDGALTRVKQRGAVRLSGLDLQREGLRVSQQALGWNGDIALELTDGQPANLALNGRIEAQGSDLEQAGRQLTLASAATALQVESADMQAFSITVPDVALTDVKLLSGERRLLALAALGLHNTEVRLPLNVKVAGAELGGLAVAGEAQDWVKLAQLQLENLDYDGDARLALQRIRISGSETAVTLSPKGELRDLAWLLQQLKAPEEAAGQAAAEDTEAQASPLRVQLGGVQFTGNNRIRFRDEGVKPAFAAELDIERLAVGALDTAVVKPTPLDLAARINRFASLTLKGELELMGDQHNGEWTLALKDLELPPLSPYSERFTGYYLNSGQFNLSSEGQITGGTIKGSNKLRINRLTVDQRDAGRVEAFSEKLTMPLETAIMVLEDNDNNITLEVPVSGALSDPQFGYQAIINDLATRGLKSAALGFLTKSLQPYATLISLAKSAVDASAKGAFITLTPVEFEPGSVALSGASRDYLNKLADMLNERQAMRLNICGRAVPADRVLLEPGLVDANRKRKEPLPPEALEQELQQHLEQLAGQRSEQVKAQLIQRVDASRVFLCFAKVDTAADALPRVELGL